MHYQTRDYEPHPEGRSPLIGKLKIVTKERPYQWTAGQRNGMSFKDAKLINELYCREMKECGNFSVISAWSHRMFFRVQLPQHVTGKCYWKITKPSSLTRIVLKIRSTGFNNPDHIVCGKNDTSYLEVKYKRDKVPTGARLCDNTWWLRHEPARAGLTMVNINADDETDVILIMKVKAGKGDSAFNLFYRAIKNGTRIENACNCMDVKDRGLFRDGIYDAVLHNDLGGQDLEVKKLPAPHCAGSGMRGTNAFVEVKCKKKKSHEVDANITINGIYENYIPIPGEDDSFTLKLSKLLLKCMRYADWPENKRIPDPEGRFDRRQEYFWTFTDPKTNRLILVDDILCLPNLPEGCKNPYCYERRHEPIGVETPPVAIEVQPEETDYSEGPSVDRVPG